MPYNNYYSSHIEDVGNFQEPHLILLPRNNPDLLAFMLDMFEHEELQRINEELRERKRLLEERLSELNAKLKELEKLKTRLEMERMDLEQKCNIMETRRCELQSLLDNSLREQNSVDEAIDIDFNSSFGGD